MGRSSKPARPARRSIGSGGDFVRRGSFSAIFAVCLLLAPGEIARAAGLLGGSRGPVSIPSIDPLPGLGSAAGSAAPGAGSALDSTGFGVGPALGSSGSDAGTILGPTFSIPFAIGSPIDPLGAASKLENLPSGTPGGVDIGPGGRGSAAGAPRAGFYLPPPSERRFVSNEIVLRIPSQISTRVIDAIAKQHRLTPLGSERLALGGQTLYRWHVEDRREIAAVVRELAGDPRIASAQPNFKFALQEAPESARGAGEPAQYSVAKLHLAEAHRLANGDNVLVAVIDSQIDAAHPELGEVIVERFDAIGGQDRPDPHGTAMAGAIAAHGALIGVAPHVRLLAILPSVPFRPRRGPPSTSFAG